MSRPPRPPFAARLVRAATAVTLLALALALAIRVALDVWPPGPGSPGDWLVQMAREAADGDAADRIDREAELEAHAKGDPVAKAALSTLRAENRERFPRSSAVRLAWARELAGRGSDAEARTETAAAFELNPARREVTEAWTRTLLDAGELGAAVAAYRRHRAAFLAVGRDDSGRDGDSSAVIARAQGAEAARFSVILIVDGSPRTITLAARRAPFWPETGEVDTLAIELSGVYDLGTLEVLSATWVGVRDLQHSGAAERVELDLSAVRGSAPEGRHRPQTGQLRIAIPLDPPRAAAQTDTFVLELRASKMPLARPAADALERACKALGEPWEE